MLKSKMQRSETLKEYDYLIVGAGLYGSIMACELKKRGKACLVIDKRGHIGGNVYTEENEGIQVHKYGAHIFHTSNKKVWDYVNNFATFNNFINSPLAFYKGEVYNLPFNMNTFNKLWGIKTPQEAMDIITSQIEKSGITEPKNLEEQGIFLGGYDIYEKFIKGYTEKQWGRSCKELPAFIIKRLPFRYIYDNNYFNDLYQGIPVDGYTKMIENFLDGIDVMTSINYFELIKKYPNIAERIIFSGMIDEFFCYRLGALEYRSLRFETEVMDIENYQGCAVVNYTESKIPYTRIIEHKHFVFGKQEKTVISHEYPQEWKLGLEPYYPINDEKNNNLFKAYLELAKEVPHVTFGGRLGDYKYYDMDKVIEAALDKVDEIL